MDVLNIVTSTLDILSSVCAFLVITLFFLIRKCHHDTVDRVSVRLQLGIAFLDLFKHFMNCFIIKWGATTCSIIGFLTTLMYHIYMCLNISIALNLYLVVFCSRRPTRKWEYIYWIVSFLIPLTLNIPVLASGLFGESLNGLCEFKNGPVVNENIELIYISAFALFTIIYCLFISIIVVYKVKSRKYNLAMESLTAANGPNTNPYSIISLQNLICRTCLYPISCFLAYIGSNFVGVYQYFFGKAPIYLLYWSRIGFCSRGILHLFAFLADPLIFKAIQKLFKAETDESQLKFNQFEIDSECEFSYHNITELSFSNTSCFSLNQMVQIFQKYT